MRHAVEVHGHRRLNEATQARPATLTGLGHLQGVAEVRRKEMAAIWDSRKENMV